MTNIGIINKDAVELMYIAKNNLSVRAKNFICNDLAFFE